MNWLWDNREWLFSGVAVTLIGGVITFVMRRGKQARTGHRQQQSGGRGSTNIQIGSIDRDSRQP